MGEASRSITVLDAGDALAQFRPEAELHDARITPPAIAEFPAERCAVPARQDGGATKTRDAGAPAAAGATPADSPQAQPGRFSRRSATRGLRPA